LAALTLAVLPVVKAGFDPSAGVDRSLFDEAKKEGHKIVGLETLEDQFGYWPTFRKRSNSTC